MKGESTMNKKKMALCLIIAVISLYYDESKEAYAANIYAKSAIVEDVNAAIATANSGDTVIIPAGNVTWNYGITITKPMTLKGDGYNTTIINCNGNFNLVTIQLKSDDFFRITGIYFKYSSNSPGGSGVFIAGSWDEQRAFNKIRIDNNKFEKGSRCVQTYGWANGVIDSNIFINCNMGVGMTGGGSNIWEKYPIEAGTTYALFIEDNLFKMDNNVGRETDDHILNQNGSNSVTRFNTFDFQAATKYKPSYLDNHGNHSYYSGHRDEMRGLPVLEFYNNTIKAYHCYRATNIRGGSNLVFKNTITTMDGSGCPIAVTEEEAWQTALFQRLRNAWPAEDQVTNSFFWENTINGKVVTDIVKWNPKDHVFIQKDRDYFMHPPEEKGGKSVYPTRKGAADMRFSSSEANAYYPYKHYTYPHPLRAGINGPPKNAPEPPKNLRIE
jgi:hypothetical protein